MADLFQPFQALNRRFGYTGVALESLLEAVCNQGITSSNLVAGTITAKPIHLTAFAASLQ
jgi:hypothetical protein